MATFITTIRFTPKGMAEIQDTCKRATVLKASAKKLGCKIVDVYWTAGAFDGLLIADAPDDETVSALMLLVASRGYVQTTTARAFTAAEMEKILATAAK